MKPASLILGVSLVIFVNPSVVAQQVNSGVDLTDKDSDGIPDAWENGSAEVTLPSGKKMTIDFKNQGASPDHKDIFVWIDWMGDTTTAPDKVQHNHRPTEAALRTVQEAFEKAPISNPDGVTGIRLHFVISPEPVPHKNSLGTGTPASLWSDFDQIKTTRFPKELEGIFHYCLFAHDIVVPGLFGVSGYSRAIPSFDFVVSLGEWYRHSGNDDEQAGTLMHELGHNLGLQHGGLDSINGKPNYLSVMNYLYQTDGLVVPAGFQRFDYSRLKLKDLDENDLDETTGLTDNLQFSIYGTRFFCPQDPDHPEGSVKAPALVSRNITRGCDWNCDGLLKHSVKGNISDNVELGLVVLSSNEDWPLITLSKPQIGVGGKSMAVVPPPAEELSVPQANTLPLPWVSNVNAQQLGDHVSLNWSPLSSSRLVGYKITRKSGDEVVIYSTDETSFIDTPIPRAQKIRYEVQALYVPHGAPSVVQRTQRVEGTREMISVGGKTLSQPREEIVEPALLGKLTQSVIDNFAIRSGLVDESNGKARVAPRESKNDVLLQTSPTAVEMEVQ